MTKRLTPEEKADRARQQLIRHAKKRSASSYARGPVAKIFQRMIRAEAAAKPAGTTPAVFAGEIKQVHREVGQVVCVTCGRVCRWDGDGTNAGHFLAGRSNPILLVEDNIAPQCAYCNQHCSGAQSEYRLWMETVRGPIALANLQELKATQKQFTHEELVDLRIGYAARLKAAEESMKKG